MTTSNAYKDQDSFGMTIISFNDLCLQIQVILMYDMSARHWKIILLFSVFGVGCYACKRKFTREVIERNNCHPKRILNFICIGSCHGDLSGSFMMFNATFNNISAISWLSVVLVEETVPGENHRPAASY
jgi:hypothetical protein